ncbi:class I adenylate-forming enzyme family protein [Microbacterium sp. A588]
MNIASAVEFYHRWQPDAPAITGARGSVTWRELSRRTGAAGEGLRLLGIDRGDRVAVLSSNSLEWCVIALAALRIGAVVVPINVRSRSPEVAYIIDKIDARAIAFDKGAAELLAPVASERPALIRVGLDEGLDADTSLIQLSGTSGEAEVCPVEAHDAAVIPFTSGTTGFPKGVILTHANVRAMTDAYAHFEGWNSSTVTLCFAPLAFNGGVTNAFLGTLMSGGHFIVEDFAPLTALDRIVENRVSVITGVPLIYEAIAALPEFADADLSSLGPCTTGGSVVPMDLLARWAEKDVILRPAYGLTEATGPITVVPTWAVQAKGATAGVPGMWDQVRVVDDAGQSLPPDEVGEIIISGPQVMAGYWDEPEQTADALRDGWLYTGDMGSLDRDGYLRIVDRRKDVIISGGINIYPAEIERVVGAFPGILEAVAFGVPHERWGETVAVRIVGDVDLEQLYLHARDHLSAHKVPRYVALIDEPLPRSGLGKVLRRDIAAAFNAETAHRTPST